MSLRLRFLAAVRRLRPSTATTAGLGRGVALRGRVWTGTAAGVLDDGVVVVGPDGRVAALWPVGDPHAGRPLPEGVRVLGGPGCWVGPGVVDAHVHLAFGEPARSLAGGVVALRDLGAPPDRARAWRGPGAPCCAVAGPVVTAPDGYPGRTWGAGGFASYATDPVQARALVRDLADGVDLLKVALEPGGGAPVPSPAVLHALVDAAHEAGLRVTAHALTVEMVTRALDAGVDELAHTPVERLPPALVERVAAAGVPVVSTPQTFAAGGEGRAAASNAAALYGTDLGNAGTRPGVDPRELDRLADAGLGREGALRRALTTGALAGLDGPDWPDGTVRVGASASLVLLPGDPLIDPLAWRVTTAVLTAGRLLEP